MIAIKQSSEQRKLTPNVLPCSIRHDGPVSVDKRYWNPISNSKDEQTAYFRGRKLEGTVVKLPAGYQGIVLQKTNEKLVSRPSMPSFDEDGMQVILPEDNAETKLFSQEASFDEVVVWGHESLPDADDAYVKGIKEWIGFAEAVGCPSRLELKD
ncbi:hypothetical protein AMS68_005257 [Peltaster fructicola]|uniref:Uncharacterized protein n=1 Tax=Peltaster fructicola TaxID=286661 RepID=A0A6H0XZA3_9PEZI|nr:hypothetical protein AMS68_005257 [Peltaster fructicola]